MADKNDEDSGAGCLFLLGAIIVGICVGNIYEAVYGWLVVGIVFVLCGLTTVAARSK